MGHSVQGEEQLHSKQDNVKEVPEGKRKKDNELHGGGGGGEKTQKSEPWTAELKRCGCVSAESKHRLKMFRKGNYS